MINRIINKIKRECWLLFHPPLWNKRLQVNGIAKIHGIKNLHIGYDVSINDAVYMQCGGV